MAEKAAFRFCVLFLTILIVLILRVSGATLSIGNPIENRELVFRNEDDLLLAARDTKSTNLLQLLAGISQTRSPNPAKDNADLSAENRSRVELVDSTDSSTKRGDSLDFSHALPEASRNRRLRKRSLNRRYSSGNRTFQRKVSRQRQRLGNLTRNPGTSQATWPMNIVSGGNYILTPLLYYESSLRLRGLIQFNSSSIANADQSVKVRHASINLQMRLDDNSQSVTSRRRHNRTKIHMFLIQEQEKDEYHIVARGKQRDSRRLTAAESGVNRSGKMRSNAVIRRYQFVVTNLGQPNVASLENFTEGAGGLSRLSSWRLPNLHLSVLCTKRRRVVEFEDCSRHGVSMHSPPYLIIKTNKPNHENTRGVKL